METITRHDRYDHELLDQALAELAQAANDARVAFIMGDDPEGRIQFAKAISALAKGVHQLQLKNRRKDS